MTTLRQLSYLIAIADEEHFGRAASRVHVAQPTLSAQFSELERKLGVRLVERGRRGVEVTPIGREIVARARKVLHDVQEIADICATADREFHGTLKLGVPPTLGPYLLPHVIPELHGRYPHLKLYVKELRPWALQEALTSGDLDLIITPLPVEQQAFDRYLLFTEMLHIVCAPDHRFASMPSLALKDLRGEKVLTLESGHQLHDQALKLCDNFGANILYDFEGTSLDTLRHMVGMGVGIAFFPELYILSEIRSDRELTVLQLRDAALSRDIRLAWRAKSQISDMAQKIGPLIRTAFESRQVTNLQA